MIAEQRANPEDPRVRFAAERTLLAWIRTGLTMMGFGFVVVRFGLIDETTLTLSLPFGRTTTLSMVIGVTLVGLGVLTNVMSTWEHVRIIRRLNRGEPYVPPKVPLEIVLSTSLTMMGVVVIAFLLFA